MPSIFTGRYPSRVAWTKRFSNYSGLLASNETLFEVFKAAGWRTEAVTAHWYFEKAKGIKDGVDRWDNRGFTTIRKSNTQSAAPQTTPRVVARLEALAAGEAPFLLFAHYFEPHGKYLNHPDVRVFGEKGLKNKYDSEIAFVDRHLQPVFDVLARPALANETVVVVTSDHGEAFQEHGYNFHGRTLYEEESRVPLIIRVPGVSARRVAHPVALVDILPTLAALTGQHAPKALGQSLAPVLGAEGQLEPVPIFMENLPYPNYKKHLVAMMDPKSGLKVVRNITDNVTEVFDLRADPREKRNLLDTSPEAGKAQRATLDAFIDADPG
jgi:choline-sulfatase